MQYIDFIVKLLYNLFVNDVDAIRLRYDKLSPFFGVFNKRILAGAESSILGHGGIAAVNKATGLARNTIKQGEKDLENLKINELKGISIRKPGGGRKRKVKI